MEQKLQEIIGMALGEISALFMSKPIKGTKIVMPSEELLDISDRTVREIVELFELKERILSEK